MGRLIIRLKAIKYNKDFFCYLSSYTPDLGLQAPCFLTLFFWPYTFKTLYSRRNASIHPSFGSQIYFNNLNSHLLSPLLTQWSTSHSNRIDQIPGSHIHCV